MKKIFYSLLLVAGVYQAQAQTNVTQLGHVDYQALHGSNLSNLWGYTDENGNEYAIVGTSDGISIVDVTNPASASEIFYVAGSNTIWREVKTYGDYAYISTESTDGLVIIDLTPLPGSTALNVSYFYGATGNTFQTAHSLFIDENGILFLHGTDVGNGGVIMYDLTVNPTNPPEVGMYDNWYIHDSYARGDTLYAAHILDGFVTIVDVSTHNSPNIIGGPVNTPKTFAHNCWLDDTGDYLFTTDEKSGAWLGAYDISNLSNIQEVDRIRRSETSGVIPHNTYWLNKYLVTSYYRDGITIHDVSKPYNMIETGNFDTSPMSGDGFNGAWGVYPYFPSGNLIVSDMEQGLFILGPTYVRGCYLEGQITEQGTGTAIGGAHVEIVGDVNFDDSQLTGNYATGVAAPGTYDVIYSKAGYYPDTIFNLSLTTGNTVIQNVQLVPLPTFSLTGTVKDQGNGTGIPNAQVVIENSLYSFTTTTDGNGNFTITSFYDDPLNNNYNVTAGIWGYVTTCTTMTIDTSNSVVNLNLYSGYYDDFTFDFGWTVTGNATAGLWERGIPVGTYFNTIPSNPDYDLTSDCGGKAFVTGNGGGAAGDDDVDGGTTVLLSPAFSVNAGDDVVSFWLWMFNAGGSGLPNDTVKVILNDNGTDILVSAKTLANFTQSTYVNITFNTSTYTAATSGLRLKVTAGDYAPGHLVESAVDLFRVGAVVSVTETLHEEGVELYPNPTNGQFTVISKDALNPITSVRLYDLSGKEVLLSSTATNIDARMLQSGMYIVHIQLQDGTLTTKRIIKH